MHIKCICHLVDPDWGFPCGTSGKEPVWQCRRWGLIDPWVGKIPWRKKWQPSPVFLPGESHGWRSLVGTAHGVAKSQTWLKRLLFLNLKKLGTSLWSGGSDSVFPLQDAWVLSPVREQRFCILDACPKNIKKSSEQKFRKQQWKRSV